MEPEWMAEREEGGELLDAAIAGHRHVEFTWVKAHSGILLNECADLLATRGVAGCSYDGEIPVTLVPAEEPESSEEFLIGDD
jgi:hypothetical protein